MTVEVSRKRPFDPAPNPGLRFEHFQKICQNGFGDGHNTYAHSMVWFKNHLYVGTSRATLANLKPYKRFNVDIWPVEGPDTRDEIYKQPQQSQIWRYHPLENQWQQVLQAPIVMGSEGEDVSRDNGYRAMAVFQGKSDIEPALYVATWAFSRAPGPLILRSVDGQEFQPVSKYGILDLPITSTRLLVPFKGRLFTSPTGARNAQSNVSGVPIVYESSDPAKGEWQPVSLPGFGDRENRSIFTLTPFGDRLYAGTLNYQGFQIWYSDCLGTPPYQWKKVIDRGAFRGAFNQVAISTISFKNALYIGTGIQGGGYDSINDIGPAAAELIRIFPDDSWDLIVGTSRETPQGKKTPLSTLTPGFGNGFNGYLWYLEVHGGWLYVGTLNNSTMLPWLALEKIKNQKARRLMERVGVDNILKNQAGGELWRSRDGENWLPVNRTGFGNYYNVGIRTLVSTPHGLFVGTANPFGPRVAVKQGDNWIYKDNPNGGLEVWLGSHLATVS